MYKEVCLERIPLLLVSVHSFPFGTFLTAPFTLFFAIPQSSYSKLIHYLPAATCRLKNTTAHRNRGQKLAAGFAEIIFLFQKKWDKGSF